MTLICGNRSSLLNGSGWQLLLLLLLLLPTADPQHWPNLTEGSEQINRSARR